MWRKHFLLGSTAAIAAGCARASAGPKYLMLGADDEPLRAAFNRDASNVRILMIVSPT